MCEECAKFEASSGKRMELYFAYREKRLTIHQFRAQMKDLGCDDDMIDDYLDGDADLEDIA